MNKSMINRITEAKMYQKKALQALLPESVTEHLEVIEREMIAIVMEFAKEIMEQKQNQGEAAKDKGQNQENRSEKQVKKVTID